MKAWVGVSESVLGSVEWDGRQYVFEGGDKEDVGRLKSAVANLEKSGRHGDEALLALGNEFTSVAHWVWYRDPAEFLEWLKT
jgi:hypothetical protein